MLCRSTILDLLADGHKTRGYTKIRHFFADFVGHIMNHGIFDFASPLQM